MHPLYDTVRQFFFVVPAIMLPFQFITAAPFGRFAPSSDGILVVDGIKTWIIMELVPPISFIYALVKSPLASSKADVGPLTGPQLLLAGLFLIHYANRTLISPLRMPSRSKFHIIVPLCGICFNLANGILLGSYLGSSAASTFLSGAFERPSYWAGVTLCVAGFCGNVLHDEILFDIRRKAGAKGKTKPDDNPNKQRTEYYGIPRGLLYRYISYPNYFCEWTEWFGYALAAAPIPPMTSLAGITRVIQPPWIFFLCEIFVMLPRAYKGHQWYHDNFADYPKERRAVVPFVL
ncbi:3-oxo-5-alpha-steroid 4-dehydrogenase-domain-containing protein [Melanogaster broomeanus]|nr:3-oxo-5-alpha-steroid 4-dehydrogenase-domain-containing protein [Melanogaster broomeanus]